PRLSLRTRWSNLSAAPHSSTAKFSVAYQLALRVGAGPPSTRRPLPGSEGSMWVMPPTTAKRLSAAVEVEASWANAGAATARAGTRARVRIRMDRMGGVSSSLLCARGVGAAERRSPRMNQTLPHPEDPGPRSAKSAQAAWLLGRGARTGFIHVVAAWMGCEQGVYVMRR